MQALLDRLRRQPLIAVLGGALLFVVVGIVIISIAEKDSPSVTGPTRTAPPSTQQPSTTSAPSSPAGSTTTPGGSPVATTTPANTVSCEVILHGKGGKGASSTKNGAITVVQPTGNASGWDGRQWLYFPENRYVEARKIVADAIAKDGCTRVVLNGFSNGGAFAAKLYCRGENFDGHLVGVMIDDPVTDGGVNGCRPANGVSAVLYWTGALEGNAKPGWSCAAGDWTCEGGTTIGIEAYSRALALSVTPSPNTTHERYAAAPEPTRWLR